MPGESNLLKPYNYREFVAGESLQYDFTTDSGRRYNCYFIDAAAYFPQYPVISKDIVTFGFRLIFPEIEGLFVEHDVRIRDTILDILSCAMKANPERLFMITYDNSDLRQRCRKITFSVWHKYFCRLTNMKVSKYGLTITSLGDTSVMYMTIFIPQTNQHLSEIRDALIDMRDELISKGHPPTVAVDFG